MNTSIIVQTADSHYHLEEEGFAPLRYVPKGSDGGNADPGLDLAHARHILNYNFHYRYQLAGTICQTLVNAIIGGVAFSALNKCNGFLDDINATSLEDRTSAVMTTACFTLANFVYVGLCIKAFRCMTQVYAVVPVPKNKKYSCVNMSIDQFKYLSALSTMAVSVLALYVSYLVHICNKERMIVWLIFAPLNLLSHAVCLCAIKGVNHDLRSHLEANNR